MDRKVISLRSTIVRMVGGSLKFRNCIRKNKQTWDFIWEQRNSPSNPERLETLKHFSLFTFFVGFLWSVLHSLPSFTYAFSLGPHLSKVSLYAFPPPSPCCQSNFLSPAGLIQTSVTNYTFFFVFEQLLANRDGCLLHSGQTTTTMQQAWQNGWVTRITKWTRNTAWDKPHSGRHFGEK